MKTVKENRNSTVNLPELANPINANIKTEAFNTASPCSIGVFIGYHF